LKEYNPEETLGDESESENMSNIDEGFCEKIKLIMTNKVYGLILFALTGLYFIITGIQYWLSDYWITELN